MLERLKLLAGVVGGVILGSLLGNIAFHFLPHSSFWVHFGFVTTIGILLVSGIIRVLKSRYKNQDSAKNIPMPIWLRDSTSISVPLSIGIVAAAWFTHQGNHANLYVDNGTDKAFVFTIQGEGDFNVKPKTFLKIEIPETENTMVINNTSRKLNINRSGNWVFNVDNKYTYTENTEVYGDVSVEDLKDQLAQATQGKEVKGEFFHTNAEYLFDAPESVLMGKRQKSKNVIILYRNTTSNTIETTKTPQ